MKKIFYIKFTSGLDEFKYYRTKYPSAGAIAFSCAEVEEMPEFKDNHYIIKFHNQIIYVHYSRVESITEKEPYMTLENGYMEA